MCLFKEITGIPCPGCGSTRAIISLFHGDVGQALWYNPMAVVLLVLFVFIAVYSVFDWILRKREPWHKESIYNKIFHRRWPVWTIVLAAIVTAANWYWNIKKGL